MNYTISAATRTALGRQAKTTLAGGSIPAVIYGHGIEPKAIQVTRSDFRKLYRDAGTSSLVDISVDGAPAVKALIQDVQVNTVSLDPSHIDFRQIRMDEEFTVEVPLKFVGESQAVKSLAGTLITSLDSVTVKCLPANLPHEIEVDLSPLNTFEDRITIGSLKLPAGVTVEADADDVIATVSRPLTEDELKKLEEASAGDVTAIKTEAEEKKAAEDAKKAEEEAAKEASK